VDGAGGGEDSIPSGWAVAMASMSVASSS
jgi:hypothetical protein